MDEQGVYNNLILSSKGCYRMNLNVDQITVKGYSFRFSEIISRPYVRRKERPRTRPQHRKGQDAIFGTIIAQPVLTVKFTVVTHFSSSGASLTVYAETRQESV